MSRYRKYEGNYLTMLSALGIQLDFPNTSDEQRKNDYTHQIDKDKPRAVVVELRQGHNALESENIIYDHAHYGKNPYYSQGDYEARCFSNIYNTNQNFLDQIASAATTNEDLLYKFELGFPYINDKGVPCALGITRLGHGPDAQYTIALIHNTVDAYDKRKVQFICTEKIAQDEFYTSLRNAHNEKFLDAAQMVQAVTEQIGSAAISQLFRTILDENNNISEQKLAKLKTRLGHHNLDDRDLLIGQIPSIMAAAEKLNPNIAKKIQDYYRKKSLDFFEHHNYTKLLKELINKAETQKPRNTDVISAFQDLYLKFIMIDFYYHKTSGDDHSKTGLPTQKVTDLQNEYAKALQNPEIDSAEFTEKINQYHRAIHYNKRIVELDQAIRTSGNPKINPIALNELPWIQNCRFTEYSPKRQNTIIEFVEALILFTKKPDTLTLKQLEQLYPKVHRDSSELALIKSRLEADNFAKQLAELEKKIANCQHPYIKTEAEKKLRYFKNMRFADESSTRQAHINDLLTTMNKFIDFRESDTLRKLGGLYDQLNLIPIEEEKAETLLLPPNIAQMRHQIEHNQYTFDPQGRALVTIFESNENPDVITWNLDITDAPNTDKEQQFYQPLLTALETQIASSIALKIITLFKRNKTAIYPLQQVLQMYLSQIAQVYQVTMQAKGVTPQMMQTALMEANKKMNALVIDSLAKGLVSASVSNGEILKKLNIDTVNNTLASMQANLRKHGKKIFIEHLRKQIQQPKKTPYELSPSTMHAHQISNKTLYFDTKKSLATEISTLQSDSEDTYREIKTYRCQGTSFEASNVIPRSIIHSTALNIRAKISTAEYQTQFQKKLTQLSKTCRYKKSPALTYYVYAADDLQIQQTLNATHAYNRVSQNQNSTTPLCFVQAPAMSKSNKKLGYPMLDWSGAIWDLTLMHEMSLCSQIAAVDNSQAFNLNYYLNFLNPSTSFLGGLTRGSNIFAFSREGRQMQNQIQTLKTAWQQDKNSDLDLDSDLDSDLGNEKFTTKTLQKMMAFDLHYDPQYTPLVQAMSLTISKQTLLNDASSGQVLADTLGRAQIFDIHPLPAYTKTIFSMLLKAVDKQTAIIAAKLLQDEIVRYCAEQPNSIAVATMLPLMAEQTQSVQYETNGDAIKQAQSDLTSPGEVYPEHRKTRRKIKEEDVSLRRPYKSHESSRYSLNKGPRLFTENPGGASASSSPSNEAVKRRQPPYKK